MARSRNQRCSDEGPLTLDRSKTADEEISAKAIDFLDRNDPKKTGEPFFVWYTPARMHVTTVLPDEYMAMVGEPGGKELDLFRDRARNSLGLQRGPDPQQLR
jgi:arylsulfatase